MTQNAIRLKTIVKIAITVGFLLLLVLITTGLIFRPLTIALLKQGWSYTSYFELVFVGLAPMALVIFYKERISMYGIQKKGLTKSMILGLLLALGYWSVSPLIGNTGPVPGYQSFNLAFPLNLYHALLGIFAYGPLEAFFVIYLIANVDNLVSDLTGRPSRALVSAGALAVPLFFGLFHVITTGSVSNAVQVALFSGCYGLIYRHTGNSIGPMTAWTLSNSWVRFLLVGCFT